MLSEVAVGGGEGGTVYWTERKEEGGKWGGMSGGNTRRNAGKEIRQGGLRG